MNAAQAKSLWEECREQIRQRLDPGKYNALFAYTEYKSYADQRLVLSIPSQFIYDMLERDEYVRLISDTLTAVFKTKVSVAYSIPIVNNRKNDSKIVVPSTALPTTAGQDTGGADSAAAATFDSQLHRGYSFENFLEGESNRLARSVGEAVAQRPARTFNPFFIFGPSGCGKTHLVNAIGWRIKQLHPEMRVLYISAHLFIVQYTDAARENRVNDFIKFYQTIDVLIVDDTQEFSGKNKTKTQNTFFHIFNHLHLNNKQIILTADKPPVQIEDVEERLLSRFKWGMQAEIERPTKALRARILADKVQKQGLKISAGIINYIATHIDDSVRDLEGIVTSLMAYSVAYNCEIDLDLVKQMLLRYVQPADIEITADDVMRRVCQYFDIAADTIVSASRKKETVYARQIFIYLASKHTKQSNVAIGHLLGGRKPSTIIYSIAQVDNLLGTDDRLRQDINEVETMLYS